MSMLWDAVFDLFLSFRLGQYSPDQMRHPTCLFVPHNYSDLHHDLHRNIDRNIDSEGVTNGASEGDGNGDSDERRRRNRLGRLIPVSELPSHNFISDINATDSDINIGDSSNTNASDTHATTTGSSDTANIANIASAIIREKSAGAHCPTAIDSDGNKLRIVVISDTHERHYSNASNASNDARSSSNDNSNDTSNGNNSSSSNSSSYVNQIPCCDLLIHAGDILMTSRMQSKARAIAKYQSFNSWLGSLKAQGIVKKDIIIIGGNHDIYLERMSPQEVNELFSHGIFLRNQVYTCRVNNGNSRTNASSCAKASGDEGKFVRIFGSSISRGRSQNKAFQSRHAINEAIEAWQLINQPHRSNHHRVDSDSKTHGPHNEGAQGKVDEKEEDKVTREGDAAVVARSNDSAVSTSDADTKDIDKAIDIGEDSSVTITLANAESNDDVAIDDETNSNEGEAVVTEAIIRMSMTNVSALPRDDTTRPIDILLTHALEPELLAYGRPRVYVFGHYHAAYGARYDAKDDILFVCGSIMNERYEPANVPIVFDLKF